MGVTVVKGRAGSGKSRYLMRYIEELIADDPFCKVLVIVPGQLTFETEKAIMRECGVAGIFGLEVMSIQRLACKIIEDTGCCAFMTNAQKAIVCAKALRALNRPFRGPRRSEASLGWFRGVDTIPGFEMCVADLISRLKSYNQTPQGLRDAAAKINDTALRDTLYDTADVFEAYLQCCGGRLDASDMYLEAARRTDGAAFLRDAHIIIDGLDSYAPAVMSLLARVIALSADTVAAFRSEGDGRDTALFASEKKDMDRFIAAAQKAGRKVAVKDIAAAGSRYKTAALKFLEANLYAYPNPQYTGVPDGITLVEAGSISEEVDSLVSHILAEVKSGRRFRDITVVGGGIDAYLPAIKAAFSLCGIPHFIDERRALSESPFFQFLYNALCAASGDKAATANYAASRYAPLDDDRKRLLLRYASRYAYRGWHYWDAFRRGDDATEIEVLRRRLMAPLLVLESGLNLDSAEKQIAAVMQFLSACGAQDKLTAFCETIDAEDTRAQHAYFCQVYEKTAQVLSGIADVFGDAPIPPQTLCALFKTGCDATRIAVIPPTTDEVAVTDISVARLGSVDVLFAIGVHDGVWPARDDGAGILSPAERDVMAKSGVDIGVFDLAAEKLKMYTTLVKPKERLYISYHTQASPSVIIDRIRRLFPDLKPRRQEIALTTVSGMGARMLGALCDALHGQPTGDDVRRACAVFLREPGWAERARRLLLRTNAAVPIAADTAAALYGGMRCSATRIETYDQCPFRHFLAHGINARAERDYTNDRIDIGTYMHLALDLFARGLISDGADIKTLSQDDVISRMEAAAVQAAQQHEGGKLQSDERLALQYAALKGELVQTALRIKKHFEGTQARIYASEQAFRGYIVNTAFGDVEMTGKIDRIDVVDGYYRVVDYKSSAKPFKISDFAAGVALQLPIYIAAARRLMDEDMRPAGGYYMRIGDPFGGSAQEVDKAARMAGISLDDPEVLTAFSTVMDGGMLSAVDQTVTKAGSLHGQGKNKFFSADELDTILRHTDTIIQRAADGIFGGDTGICPAEDACAYCDYADICLINEEYDGNMVRPVPRVDKEKLMEALGDE